MWRGLCKPARYHATSYSRLVWCLVLSQNPIVYGTRIKKASCFNVHYMAKVRTKGILLSNALSDIWKIWSYIIDYNSIVTCFSYFIKVAPDFSKDQSTVVGFTPARHKVILKEDVPLTRPTETNVEPAGWENALRLKWIKMVRT